MEGAEKDAVIARITTCNDLDAFRHCGLIIEAIVENLDVKKTELIGQLHQVTQRKLKELAAQRDQMETIQAQLSSCLDFVRESLRTGSQGQVLKMKTNIVKQVRELSTPFQPDIIKPNTEADMVFSALKFKEANTP